MLESARGRMSASPNGVLEMLRCEPGALYLAMSEGDMNWDEEPPGVVGV